MRTHLLAFHVNDSRYYLQSMNGFQSEWTRQIHIPPFHTYSTKIGGRWGLMWCSGKGIDCCVELSGQHGPHHSPPEGTQNTGTAADCILQHHTIHSTSVETIIDLKICHSWYLLLVPFCYLSEHTVFLTLMTTSHSTICIKRLLTLATFTQQSLPLMLDVFINAILSNE